MSEKNVELVREYFDARRREGREGVFRLLASDVCWEARGDLPDTAVYTGHEGVRAFFERFRTVLGEMWFEPTGFIAAGDNVVVPLRWGGRGKGSGLDFVESEAWVFTVRARVIVHVKEYDTKQEALKAVGLEE